MEALIAKQGTTTAAFDKFITNLKKCSKANATVGYLRGRLEGLRELWSRFQEIHNKILLHADEKDSNHSYFVQETYEKYEALYYEYFGIIEDRLMEHNQPTNVSFNTSHCEAEHKSSVALPQINLPKFSGEYSEWRHFHDMFTALIQDNGFLSGVQKLHYLKTSVSGEAEQLLRSYSITETNFTPAWNALRKRYENKRLLATAQLNLLFSKTSIKESAASLRHLYDTTNESISALKALGVTVDHWDLPIIHSQIQNLSAETRHAWEKQISTSSEPPTLQRYLEFLDSRFRLLEATAPTNTSSYTKVTKRQSTFASVQLQCSFCSKSHHIRNCMTFKSISGEQKLKVVKSNSLCTNCLARDHSSTKCPSKRGCFQCGRRHHSSLHEAYSVQNTDNNSTMSTSNAHSTRLSLVVNKKLTTVLLSTALVNVTVNGNPHTLRVLIDTGSQVSFITVAASQRLRLPFLPTAVTVTGIGNTSNGNARRLVKFQIQSRRQPDFTTNVEAIVLTTLTDYIPQTKIILPEYKHLQNLDLADPLYDQPGAIDAILGSDVYPAIVREGINTGPPNTPMAQNTALGWILLGPVESSDKAPRVFAFLNTTQLDQQLRKFWEVEEPVVDSTPSEDEIQCEDHYQHTHQRDTDGRYIVALPFKSSPGQLGPSYSQALRQFLTLERRFLRDLDLYANYKACFAEYIKLGQMKRIPPDEIDSIPHYYVPHHPVVKPSSTTTKVRPVFNASCKSLNGPSLNDLLHTGRSLHQDLTSVIIRWRMHRVAFSSDMEKMFRCIGVRPDHCDFLRILFRFHPDLPVEHLRVQVVLFGLSPAPFLAMRTIDQLVQDEGGNFQLGAKVLSNATFVDNVLSGADDIAEALKIQEEITNLLQRGGFKLRQWAANVPDLISHIPEADRLMSPTLEISNDSRSINALGLAWDPVSDTLFLQSSIKFTDEEVTKRSILSLTARLFDPLGWYAPIIVVAKITMQKLWLLGLNWDEPLPADKRNDWKQFELSISGIDRIRVPRWIHATRNSAFQIHAFCDASQRAYATAVYVRIQSDNRITTHLIIAKTRVSPVKTISLPRLELCGAALLATVVKKIIRSLDCGECEIYAWTDSTIVLAWLQDHPCRWKTFVANRTSYIHECLPTVRWQHTKSDENPADLATRGSDVPSLMQSSLWWHGPTWLSQPAELWPIQPKPHTKEEVRRATALTVQISPPTAILNLEKFSSYIRLIRVTAYCLRFIFNCRLSKDQRTTDHLKAIEMERAKQYWIRVTQGVHYTHDIQSLESNQNLKIQSKIQNLAPFVDQHRILRVGGRLHHADLPYDEKHPMLLQHNDHFTNLIISYYHSYTLHGNVSLMMATIRKQFWIPKLRSLVKSIVFHCVRCFRFRKISQQQLMGDLPRPRVTPARPFSTAGIDYAGPIAVRMSKGRNPKTYKGYIAVFVCLSTRAIHLEVVSDLTTDALLAALRRFTARRGLCAHLYSDCGTNFIGAKAQLKDDYERSISKASKEVAGLLALDRVNWHFIPPGSPHFGGLWESGVRSVKYHLRRIVGTTQLTYEELSTVLAQIEATLNSRPLCPLSDDPNEISSLTPGHFLIGDALNAPPQEDLNAIKLTGLKRWALLQRLHQDFWNRWRSEFLHRLQQRPKWLHQSPNVKVGDLVILKDERMPPLKWMLARIIHVYPGADGLVRVVDVRTAESILRRPVRKLCRLPIDADPRNDN